MNSLIRVKLKELANLEDVIKKDNLNYKLKRGKSLQFRQIFIIYYFLRDINEGYLSLADADNEQSNFATELENFDKCIEQLKKVFENNLGLFFNTRERVLNFKSRLFTIKNLDKFSTQVLATKLAPIPTKHKKSKLELRQEFMKEIIGAK